jgi:hypothetical protein
MHPLWIIFGLLSVGLVVLLVVFFCRQNNPVGKSAPTGANGPVLAFVHHPKCRACVAVKPTMLTLQAKYGEDRVVFINALTDRPETWSYVNAARGFPTIGLLDPTTDTIAKEYFGPRTMDALSTFIQAHVAV